MHDRLKADTLLGILDQGKWRFPLWQFAPDGPNGVIGGLAQVLQALQMSNLAKARWLQRPHPVFGGLPPWSCCAKAASTSCWRKLPRWVVVRIDPPPPSRPPDPLIYILARAAATKFFYHASITTATVSRAEFITALPPFRLVWLSCSAIRG